MKKFQEMNEAEQIAEMATWDKPPVDTPAMAEERIEFLQAACDALATVYYSFDDADPALSDEAWVMLETLEKRLKVIAPEKYDYRASQGDIH